MSIFGALCDTASLVRSAQDYLRRIATRSQAQSVDPSAAGAAGLYQTGTDGAYPTNPKSVFVLIPQECDADDSEGATASYTGDASQATYGVGTGTTVPPLGTTVTADFVGGRLCFNYNGP